jgi:hypothetical protein
MVFTTLSLTSVFFDVLVLVKPAFFSDVKGAITILRAWCLLTKACIEVALHSSCVARIFLAAGETRAGFIMAGLAWAINTVLIPSAENAFITTRACFCSALLGIVII